MELSDLTEVQLNLLDQLKGMHSFFIYEYSIKTILTIDNGLRLCTRNNGTVINIDITYNYGKDLYEIKAYKINGFKAECKEIANYSDVFSDQLHEFIRGILFN